MSWLVLDFDYQFVQVQSRVQETNWRPSVFFNAIWPSFPRLPRRHTVQPFIDRSRNASLKFEQGNKICLGRFLQSKQRRGLPLESCTIVIHVHYNLSNLALISMHVSLVQLREDIPTKRLVNFVLKDHCFSDASVSFARRQFHGGSVCSSCGLAQVLGRPCQLNCNDT